MSMRWQAQQHNDRILDFDKCRLPTLLLAEEACEAGSNTADTRTRSVLTRSPWRMAGYNIAVAKVEDTVALYKTISAQIMKCTGFRCILV